MKQAPFFPLKGTESESILMCPGVPDVSSSDKNGLFAFLTGDAINWELGDVVTTVSVDLRQLNGNMWWVNSQKNKINFL